MFSTVFSVAVFFWKYLDSDITELLENSMLNQALRQASARNKILFLSKRTHSGYVCALQSSSSSVRFVHTRPYMWIRVSVKADCIIHESKYTDSY